MAGKMDYWKNIFQLVQKNYDKAFELPVVFGEAKVKGLPSYFLLNNDGVITLSLTVGRFEARSINVTDYLGEFVLNYPHFLLWVKIVKKDIDANGDLLKSSPKQIYWNRYYPDIGNLVTVYEAGL